jgi:hypothetical protein
MDRAAARGDAMSLRDTLRRRTEQVSTWLVARAGRAWGLLVIAVVLALTWQALRGIHVHEVRVLLRSLDGRWLVAAGAITLANVADHGPLRRHRLQPDAHERRRALALRRGRVLLEQLPDAGAARRTGHPPRGSIAARSSAPLSCDRPSSPWSSPSPQA